jgi:hypothetical protein
VATNVVARDIDGAHAVNYDVPKEAENLLIAGDESAGCNL